MFEGWTLGRPRVKLSKEKNGLLVFVGVLSSGLIENRQRRRAHHHKSAQKSIPRFFLCAAGVFGCPNGKQKSLNWEWYTRPRYKNGIPGVVQLCRSGQCILANGTMEYTQISNFLLLVVRQSPRGNSSMGPPCVSNWCIRSLKTYPAAKAVTGLPRKTL